MKTAISFATMIGVLCGLMTAQADDIPLPISTAINSGANSSVAFGNNVGQTVVASQWYSMYTIKWSSQQGKQALPGGVFTLTTTRDDIFTPNATGSSEAFGSPLDLNLGSYSYNQVAAAGLTDYGNIAWLVNATGTKLTLSGVGLTNVFNAGVAGLLNSIVFSSPASANFGAGEVFDSTGGPDRPMWNQPVATGVPEPSALPLILGGIAVLGVCVQRHRRRSLL